jgi:hypothetical protein
MVRWFVMVTIALVLCAQVQQCVFADSSEENSSGTKSSETKSSEKKSSEKSTVSIPTSKPWLPNNPTYGGKEGNPGAVLSLARDVLIKKVEEGCRQAEKKKPSDRALDEIVLTLPGGQMVVYDLRLVSLTLPLVLDDFKLPNSLCWCTEKGRLSGTGLWTFTQILSDNQTVNYTGQVYIPPVHFGMYLNTTLGRNSDNKPAITEVGCRMKLDKTKMFFSSPNTQAQKLVMDIEANITELISQAIESSLCELTSFVLQVGLNFYLSTFRTKIEIWNEPQVILDYSLIADPFIDPIDYSIKASLKGSIYVNGSDALSIYPHDLASFSSNNTNRTVTTLFSDYMLNSLLASAYQSNMFDLITVNKSFSKDIEDYFGLKCDKNELCFGSVFPSTSAYPKKSYAELSLSIIKVPTVVFLESGAYLQVNGTMSWDIKSDDTSSKFNRYSAPFSLVSVLTPYLRQDSLYNFLYMETKVIELLIKDDSVKKNVTTHCDKAVSLMTPIFEGIMNKPLRRGIPVPMFLNNKVLKLDGDNFSFFNRTLVMNQFVPPH